MAKGGTLYEAWAATKRPVQTPKTAVQPVTKPAAAPPARSAFKRAASRLVAAPAAQAHQDLPLESPVPTAAATVSKPTVSQSSARPGSLQMKRSSLVMLGILGLGLAIGGFVAGRHATPARPVLSPVTSAQLQQMPPQPSVLDVATPPPAPAATAAQGDQAAATAQTWDMLLHQGAKTATPITQSASASAAGQ